MEKPHDIPSEEFVSAGMRAIDWIARYLEEAGRSPVVPPGKEGSLISRLPASMPEVGERFEEIEKDFVDLVLPHVTHWNHPRFLAYFSISGSAPGILGELYSAALNTNGMKWSTNPASAELESLTLQWLRDALGLPGAFSGILADLASTATLLSLAVAREKATDYRSRNEGLGRWADSLVLYASEEAHISVQKAALVLGLGVQAVRTVPTDERFRLRSDELRPMIEADRAAGKNPFAVVATLGTTATTSVDPIDEIATIAEKENLWLHVDAAYAGPAAILKEKRPMFAGWERADSIVVNPHKWLFVPIDASALFFRDPAAYRHTFSIVPAYLESTDRADDPMDYGFQLGRRFRSLKLWFVFRAFGRSGLEKRIRYHIDMAGHFVELLDGSSKWEILAPVPFSTICFRYCGEGGASDDQLDQWNAAILEEVNRGGDAFLSHAVLKGRYAIRLTIGNIRTTESDIDLVWERLREAAAECR